MSSRLSPLYLLLRKNSRWCWTKAQEKAFQAVKSGLSSDLLLVHFDPNKKIILTCDASPYGVGAVLSHLMNDGTEHPISFVSRTLSQAERNYAHIEKEGLAIIFGVRRFHSYLFGRHFTIRSDHQPLRYLFGENKAVPTLASARIQRWALILSSYSYTVSYKPGSQIPQADALSRLPLDVPMSSTVKAQEEEVFLFAEHQGPMVLTSKQVKYFTACDPVLSAVVRFTLQGWPTKVDNQGLQPYWCRRLELTVSDNCLLWGSRVVIPPQIRDSVLKELHDTHIGISRMKSLARSYVWWPSLNKDIETMVRTCIPCQSLLNAPAAVPLHPWEWPQRPWCRLHLDYAGPFMGKMFLVVVDAHSKWLEVKTVPAATSKATIVCLQSIFATHGLPERVVTDNGSVFTSEEFKEFLEANGIAHSTSSPYHPASNGLAERAVQSFKQSMRKFTSGSIESKLSRFLFTYRLTPHATTSQSPAELLLKRRPRSRLDILVQVLSKWLNDVRTIRRKVMMFIVLLVSLL